MGAGSSKHEALSSNSSTTKKKKKREMEMKRSSIEKNHFKPGEEALICKTRHLSPRV
jgi:hypothetical protein